MTIEYFKQLVNETQPKIPTELESIYKYLGITENGSYLTSAITDGIYILIRELLFTDNKNDPRISTFLEKNNLDAYTFINLDEKKNIYV